MDKVGRIIAAIAVVVALVAVTKTYVSQPTNLDPEVAKWVNDQFQKNTLAAKVQAVIDEKEAGKKAAEAEVEKLKKELEAVKPKGK